MSFNRKFLAILFILALFSISAVAAEENNTQSDDTIISHDVTKYYKNDTAYHATLLDTNKTPLKNTTVFYDLNGVRYNRTTNDSGSIKVSINLNSGKYQLNITNPVTNESKTDLITVLPTISGENLNKYYRNQTQYYATFVDSSGNPLVNTNITYNINGVFYNRTTNDKGVSRLNINLGSGKYILTAINTKTNESSSNNITVLETINGKNITKYYRNQTQYYATFIKGDGSKIADTNVTFNINGVFYNRTTDKNGTAKLNINLEHGTYILTAHNPETKEMYSNTIEVLSKIVVKDVRVDYKSNGTYTATIVDGEGKPLENQKVRLNINGVFYNRTTDKNGSVSLTINLPPGSYICTAYANDSSIGSNVNVNKVSAIMTVLNTTVKRDGYYQVKIEDSMTKKPVENIKVIFTFNQYKVSYYVHTNASGIASVRMGLFNNGTIPLGTFQMISYIENDTWYKDLAKYFKITVIE